MTDDEAVQAKLDKIKAVLDSQHDRIEKLQLRILRREEPKANLENPSQV